MSLSGKSCVMILLWFISWIQTSQMSMSICHQGVKNDYALKALLYTSGHEH